MIHHRSFDIHADGRTLEGVAYHYERASKVSDDGRTFYLEAIGRTADKKTLTEHPARPLFRFHRRSEDPIGAAAFERTPESLMFRARLSNTRAADETLELVNDGAMTDASVGFFSLATKRVAAPDASGILFLRTEIRIMELSLAPTGFGQHQGAGVLAVRADTGNPTRLEASRRRLRLLDLHGVTL